MKRAVLLIFVLLLMIDLGEDGGLGKVTFVAPTSSAKTSLSSPLLPCSGKLYCRHTLLLEGWEISRLVQLQQVTLEIQPALKILIFTNTSSSGGIPL